MKFNVQHIKNIAQAKNDNRLAIFIGAGISKFSDTITLKLPTWSDLIDALKKELGLEQETDFLKIAQLYYLEFGEYTYYEKLKEYFPENISPSDIHKKIFELKPQVIVTTNWDNILEKTIEENAYIYDIIRCDEDLVKSTLQKKVIKMHGDFKNHNIVFKEDDYLNYQYKFPLIENYIKSILSTHTVLFFGYSYNDVNLKLIMKWLQNNSKVQPPKYLTIYKENSTQEKYLENHGIKVLLLDTPNKNVSKQSDYYDNTDYFLNLIKDMERIEFLKSDKDIINFVYNKLKVLSQLSGILLEQIQNVLTNCGFIYDNNGKIILEFYDRILTYDINNEKRKIYQRFKQILKNIDKDKIVKDITISKIFEILKKANIDGIIISDEDLNTVRKEYIDINSFINEDKHKAIVKFLDFDIKVTDKNEGNVYNLLKNAFYFYQFEDYKKSYQYIEKTISVCLKQKNYAILFIAMFNRNLLLRQLKFDFNSREDFKDIEEYELQEKYIELPKDLQIALKPIYDFIDWCYLYKYSFQLFNKLKKKEEEKRTIEGGGFVFSSNITEFSSKHKNLLSFILLNGIMIENFNEFTTIIKHFIRIALIRQIQKENVSLNKIELFSAIKYIDHKRLKVLFEPYYRYDSESKGKFIIDTENKKWLIYKVFPNITDIYINNKKIFNKYERYIKNTIFLLAITKLSKKEADKVLNIFMKISEEAINTIGIYETMNLFFGIQNYLFNTDITDEFLIRLIETIINKLVYHKYNGHDFHAITRNELYYLYEFAKKKKAIFKNEDLINRLLFEISKFSIDDQINISQSLLLNIYDISTKKIKEKIKDYVVKIDSKKANNLLNHVMFKLYLTIRGLDKLDKDIFEQLTKYFEQFKNSKTFSSQWYSLKEQLNYLVKEKNYLQLKPILETVEKLVESYEDSEINSIF